MINLIGNKLAQDYLSRVLSGPVATHAYLISGLPGLGKLTLVKILVAKLHGLKKIEDLMGDVDCKLVETSVDKKDISIDQVREITEFLKLASWGGHKRVVIINNAEDLNAQAANALLKTLEEPLGRALIFLISSRPQMLLPTIKSRCQIVNMTPVNDRELALWLEKQGVVSQEMPELLGLSQGRPGLALDWVANREWREERHQLAQSFLLFVKSNDTAAVLEWMQKNLVAKTSRLVDTPVSNISLMHKALGLINIWLEITRDLILCKYNLSPRVINQSFLAQIQEASNSLSVMALVGTEETLITGQSRLKANANVRLTIEWLLITIKVTLLNNNKSL